MQASKEGSASNAESSNSNSTEPAPEQSVMEKSQDVWQAVARPWSPQGVTNQASTNQAEAADSANGNFESERLRTWYAEPSKDQVYNAIGFVRSRAEP